MRSKADGGRLRFIEFQQPTLVEAPPEGDGWLHEIKYDGYRTELLIERGKARAFTRRGFDWTDEIWADRRGGGQAAGEVGNRRWRGHRHERGRPVGLLDAAIGDALAARAAGLRRLRPALPRRQGSSVATADRARGRAGEADRRRHPAPSSSAIMSPAAGMPSMKRSTGWGSRAWCRSGPARLIAAAAPKAG